jgi:hypothetical protein
LAIDSFFDSGGAGLEAGTRIGIVPNGQPVPTGEYETTDRYNTQKAGV